MTPPDDDPRGYAAPRPTGRTRPADPAQRLQPFVETLRQVLPTPEEIQQRSARRKRRQQRLISGLFLCMLTCVGLWVWNPVRETRTWQTDIGLPMHAALPDGTQLAVNTNSRLRMTDRLRSREFELEQGEAIFTVASSWWRPLSVRAGAILVRDIGTVFAVRHTQAGQTYGVMVLEGAVDVRDAGGRQHRVQANEALRLEQAGHRAHHHRALPWRLAWREGQLAFNQTPLANALADMQRYRPGAIRLHGEALRRLPISGQFSLNHLDDMLAFLPRIAPVRIVTQDDGSLDIHPAE